MADIDDVRVYKVAEIAEITGMSKRAILDDCRSGTVEHVHRGNLRGMTARQLALFLARFSEGAAATQPTAVDEVAQARKASRKNVARRSRVA